MTETSNGDSSHKRLCDDLDSLVDSHNQDMNEAEEAKKNLKIVRSLLNHLCACLISLIMVITIGLELMIFIVINQVTN